jgi:hypothetical protein
MFLDATIWQAMAVVGGIGGLGGLIGGFISSADSLFGTLLMGVIGGVAGATIMRIAGAPGIYTVGDGFSLVWGGLFGLVLGFVVGKAN